jgi:hypothetical protein
MCSAGCDFFKRQTLKNSTCINFCFEAATETYKKLKLPSEGEIMGRTQKHLSGFWSSKVE